VQFQGSNWSFVNFRGVIDETYNFRGVIDYLLYFFYLKSQLYIVLSSSIQINDFFYRNLVILLCFIYDQCNDVVLFNVLISCHIVMFNRFLCFMSITNLRNDFDVFNLTCQKACHGYYRHVYFVTLKTYVVFATKMLWICFHFYHFLSKQLWDLYYLDRCNFFQFDWMSVAFS